ncbi:peptidylprolyl isomerase [Reinekea sp.]|uniref:peptidylprolyl isomerase n=1 Tax=Reinekea sp. TaxID=1970455 RepID=UPI002A8412A2|nr:peptidylprolyl isomerase [Reinekea sp.]
MSRLKNGLLGTLLCLGTATFAQTLDSIAVVVNDDVVTNAELATRMALIKAQYSATPGVLPNDAALSKQILAALILESLQLQLAQRGNLVIPEQQVDEALANIAKNQKMSASQFLSAMQNSGRNVDAFRQQIRNELTITQVQRQIVGRQIFVSNAEIDRFLSSQSGQSLKDTEYQLGYLRFEAQQREQAESLLERLNQGGDVLAESASKDLGFRPLSEVPSIFRTLVPVLNDREAVLIEKEGVLHLAQLITRTAAESVNIREYSLRHILIKTDALFETGSAKALLNDLREQILGGADMAQLADQFSQDAGTKGLGGDLGWNSLDNYVPEFSAVARTVESNQVSDVFESPFGFHILRVEDTRTRDVGIDVLRNQVRNQLSQRRYTDALQRWQTELRAESYIEYRP